MYERLEECPSCKHTKFLNYKICHDHSVSGESFALVKCEKCQLVFTNPRPDQENIGKYYQSEDYISHTNKANNLVNLIYKFVRNITLSQKISLIKKFTSGKTLFDFGCGTGTFLAYAKKHGFDISGYEPDSNARTIAAEQTSIDIFHNQTFDKEPNKYEVITAWHVIEHVHDLRPTLINLRKALKDNGFLFVALPNVNSHDAKIYKESWAAYDVPRHLYHFDQDSLSYLAKQCKLKLKSVHPMKFDSYYVSMLSEKYIHGKNNFLSAIKNGLKSNQLANKTGEYSSLIYVLTK